MAGGNTLDTARSPEDLVPGSPDALDSTIAGLTTLGVSAQDAGGGMTRLCTGDGWTGQAAEAFRAVWQVEPDRWSSLGDALANAARALEPYRDALRHGQGEALLAMAEWHQAQQLSAAAAAAYQQMQHMYDTATLLGEQVDPPPAFVDPGAAGRAAAVTRLAGARNSVGEAALTAVRVLIESRDALPAEPNVWRRFADGFVDTFATLGTQAKDFAGGAVDATIGMVGAVQRINPASPYNETHPQQYQHRLDEAGQAVVELAEHPGDAVRSMVSNAVQTWTHDPGRALGALVPGALLGAVTGGAGDAAVTGSQLADVAADEMATSDLTAVAGATGGDTVAAADTAGDVDGSAAASSVNATTPRGSWTLATADADAAAATRIEDSGAGLAQVERDLAGLHVHPDPTPPVADTTPTGIPARSAAPAAHSVSRVPEWGSFAGWDLPARALTTNPIADRAAEGAVESAGSGLAQVERDLSRIHVRPGPADAGPWPVTSGKLMPERSVGGFDLTPPTSDTPAPKPALSGRLPVDYTDRTYLVDGAIQRAYLDRYPPSPTDYRWLDDIRARWPEAERLTDADLLALHQYKTSAYELNRALRSGSTARMDDLDTEIRVTASALNKLPDYHGLVIRARGVNLHPHQLERILRGHEPGKVVQEPGFTSTDKRPPGYGVIEYRILSQHGKDISPMLGQDTGVQEVLFPPGSRFRVDDRSYNPTSEKWEIHLTNVEG